MMQKKLVAVALTLVSVPLLGDDAQIRVLVAYHTRTGHTRAMAEAVAEGVRSVEGTAVQLAPVAEVEVSDLLAADAVVLGSPVHNANVTPEVQSFINRWPFGRGELRDKIGAAFVSAGGISAGEEVAQLAILRSMLVHGMIVVGGPHWTGAFGASAVTEEEPFSGEPDGSLVNRRFLDKARGLGRRVAEVTLGLRASSRSRAVFLDDDAVPQVVAGSNGGGALETLPIAPPKERSARCNTLELLDTDGDGLVTGFDRYWRYLYLWVDGNGDDEIQEDEIRHLFDGGIRKVRLDLRAFVDADGETGDVLVQRYILFGPLERGAAGALSVDATGIQRRSGLQILAPGGQVLEGFQPFRAGLKIRDAGGRIVDSSCP